MFSQHHLSSYTPPPHAYMQEGCLKRIKSAFNDGCVYSADNIPKINNYWNEHKQKFLIVNLSKQNENGTHFIFIENSARRMFYWDPLNLKYIEENIKEYMVENAKKIKIIKHQVQSYSSVCCGLFCIALVVARHYEMTYKKFFSFFSRNYNHNDKRILKVFEFLLNK